MEVTVATQEMTKEANELLNKTMFHQLTTPGMEKQAIDNLNDFVRLRMREDGLYRKYANPPLIGNDELDKNLEDDKPMKIFEKEPSSPGAVTFNYGTFPKMFYIHGRKFRVTASRIATPRFQKDTSELRTYTLDLRQVLSDNSAKDAHAEEDRLWIGALNTSMGGSVGAVSPQTGVVQWKNMNSSPTRDACVDAKKILPRSTGSFEAHTAITNHITIKEIEKWGRDEMGGNLSENMVQSGWTLEEFLGMKWIITIKRNLVPDGRMYLLGAPANVMRGFLLEDLTLYMETKAFMFNFFSYAEGGHAIANVAAVSAAEFIVA
jgi:hypothetical protein